MRHLLGLVDENVVRADEGGGVSSATSIIDHESDPHRHDSSREAHPALEEEARSFGASTWQVTRDP